MEIREIKERLAIGQVLAHYGLTPVRNRRLCCPFHNDKTPSMQVYPETNTVFCFSSNCKLNGKAIDQIDFIMHKEDCTKHEAIEKAQTLLGTYPENKPTHTTMNVTAHETPGRIAVLMKLFYEAKESLARSQKAQGYCEQRGLDWKTRPLSRPLSEVEVEVEMGFLEQRYYHGWNDNLKKSAIEIGLLKENPNKSISPVFKNCIIFPIKNSQGQVVNMYGRSTTDNKDQRHYYLKGKHQGIYPNYPKPGTTKLIIAESIIDTATLLQIEAITAEYGLLALYGTNGLTEEITEAIKQLPELAEIIFMLDGDEAGSKATEKYSQELHELIPGIKISKAELPEGEDVNSLLVGHEPEIINHILKERSVLFSIEKQPVEEMEEGGNDPGARPGPGPARLNTSNLDKIIYDTPTLKIEIWGGIEFGNMHRLRLSLHLENKETGQSFRDDVNLYSNRSSKAFVQDASEELEIPQSELKSTIDALIREVEEYRLTQKQNHKGTNKKDEIKLSLQEQQEAMKILQDKNIINHLKSAMQKTGMIGETENGLLLFLIFLTRYFATPLHALVHGSTGSGKTNLLKSILKLVPEESKYETTALTENVLFRPPYKEFWKNKILLIEDLDGSYKALLPLREFMTNQYISKLANDPNPKTGKYEQVTLEAIGPIVIAGATTKDRLYEDNSNRSFLLHVNESKAHEERVLDYQNREAAGLIDTEGIQAIAKKIQDMQRMLSHNVKVINPFQPQLKLPEYVFTKKRTNTHYITLIKSITFLFQHQRERKKDNKGLIYIETTLQDVELANTLSKESLLRKSDELSGQVREFFEVLKASVKQTGKESFVSKEIREKFRMHPMKFNRRIKELQNRGYIKQIGGNYKTSYEYQIIAWDDYLVLKQGLQIMDDILEKLWKRYPDGKFSK